MINVNFGNNSQVMIKFFGFYYLVLVMLALVAAVTFPLWILIFGISVFAVFVSLIFFGFQMSPRAIKAKHQVIPSVNLSDAFIIFQMVGLIFSLNYVVTFYTGSTIISAVQNIASGISNYLIYQQYFKDGELGQLTIAKIAPVLSNVYIKLSFLHSIYLLFSPGSKQRLKTLVYFSFTCAILLLYSICRGTNFELFEIVFSMFFCISYRKDLIRAIQKHKLHKFLILGVVVILLTVFLQSVNARAIISCYTQELCIDESALLAQMSEGLSYLTFVLSGYFSYGFYYLGHVVVDVLNNDVLTFILFPQLFGFDSFGVLMCDVTFDCGVNWEPDISRLIGIFGLLPAGVILFLIGFILRSTYNLLLVNYSFELFCIVYMISLYLISLPVGQFISASSQNSIILLLSILYLFFRPLLKASFFSK